MARLRALLAALVLAACAALALAACGSGDDAKLLPGKTADQINSNLDQVRALASEGDCAGAESAVSEVSAEVEDLGNVDRKLKAALRQGTAKLGEVVDSCGEKALAEAEKQASREQAESEAAEEQEAEEQAGLEAEEEVEAEEEKAKEEKAQQKADEKAKEEADEKAGSEEAPKPEPAEPEPPVEPEEKEPMPTEKEPPAGGVGPGAKVE